MATVPTRRPGPSVKDEDAREALRAAEDEERPPTVIGLMGALEASRAPSAPGWLAGIKPDGSCEFRSGWINLIGQKSRQIGRRARFHPLDQVLVARIVLYLRRVRAAGGAARVLTRYGQDRTAAVPTIATAAARRSARDALLGGERLVFDRAGRRDFSTLPATLGEGGGSVAFVAFDVLFVDFVDGADLRDRAVDAREAPFVFPRRVVDVACAGPTGEGRLRQPVFKGISTAGPEPVRLLPGHPRGPAAAGPAAAEATRGRAAAMRAHVPRRVGSAPCGVRLSSPDRVLLASQGVTKAAIAAHYLAHMERMLPHIEDRPLTLLRCPRGRDRSCFVQRHPEGMPQEMAADIGEDDGRAIRARTPADVMALVQRGVLEIHPRGARVDRPDRPDRLVFDLDPGGGVAFEALREAALALRDRLAALDLAAFLKTTGGKGLHVMLPIERRTPFAGAKEFARAVAGSLMRSAPGRYVLQAGEDRRRGRIFIDILRNDRKASAVAPFSTRAREGAPFAVPLAWETLERAGAMPVFRVGDVVEGQDPWADVARVRQRLTKAHFAGAARG